ncbi:hypothetical protein AUR64_15230 [Haloprofundus marisrubri]|uniref:Uncharacterized protein n=1 Tax=Haloprofundus marisrubri TaxID=1514971 RepID=A0A0W1R6V5_9EURY|nr:hypothetical protein [Haloprofundus marisrubri]KTG09146.1 hypothetical protein AUR64_15230 [Haloprofundus marisrubri]
MFEWLFPGWSNPFAMVVFVSLRILLNAALTGLTARSAGRRSPLTLLVGAGTLVSAVMVVLLLRPGGLGYTASFVEFALQLVIVALAGYAVLSTDSKRRRVTTATTIVGALALLLFSVPIYGEAFVAP